MMNKQEILNDINEYLLSVKLQTIDISNPILSDYFCKKFNFEVDDYIDYFTSPNGSPTISEIIDCKYDLIDTYVLPKLGYLSYIKKDINIIDDISEWFPDENPNQSGKKKVILDIGQMFNDNSGTIDIFSN